MGLLFSIIIPVYNGEQCIIKCLNSIYNQGLKEEDFEVICVNDASTDNTAQVISEYQKSHDNLKLITHEKNRRQGAARNTGVKAAKGEYILYIDADDTFVLNALSSLKKELKKNEGLDILKFDHVSIEGNKRKEYVALSDSQEIMSGREFLLRNSIQYAPWVYTFRREFLKRNNLYFVEGVVFEDGDFIIDCIRHAACVKYSNIITHEYYIYDNQTTKVGKNEDKVQDFFRECERMKYLYLDERDKNCEVAAVINAHYEYREKNGFFRYWWLLPYKSRKKLLMMYKPIQPYTDKWLRFIDKYPMLFLMTSVIFKPALSGLRFIYRFMKYRLF